MALKGKQAQNTSLGLNLLKTNASASDEGKIMVFDANNALAIYDPLVFGASSVSMTGDVIVTGDLNVNGGNITSFDTVNVSLKDNIISVAGSAGSAADGGFQLNKSAGGSVSLKWKEIAGEWEVSLADASEHVIADVAAMDLADGAVQQGIIYQSGISVAAEGVLSGETSTEAAARLLADQQLSGTVNTNTNTLDTNLGLSVSGLTNEGTRSSGAREVISGLLGTEEARALAAEGVIHSAITGETARATSAESGLSTDIGNETTRAQGKEGELNTLIGNETTRATDAEKVLSDKLTGQTANRVYGHESLDLEIGTFRYGDAADGYMAFMLGTYNGVSPDGGITFPDHRSLHGWFDLTLSDGSTVSAGNSIQAFTAYTENDAKVAESELDNNRYNTEIMRAAYVGEPGAEWYTLSNYVNADGTLTTSGQYNLDRFNAGNYSFDNLKKMIDEKYKGDIAVNAHHYQERAESRSYSHTVTHSISATVSSGTLTIPAMEDLGGVYNYDNIAGYWGVTAGGADLRNWANWGDINVRVNGLELSEDAVSYSLADKAGVINGTYNSAIGTGNYARSMYGGADGELAVQITSVIIDVDKVGYEIDSDDVIEIIYDKRRAKAVTEGYSPDAEVTECGDATMSNYVPNLPQSLYDNSKCVDTFPTFDIAFTHDINFRIALPWQAIDGMYANANASEGSGNQTYPYYQNAIGDLSLEIGTVAAGVLTPIGTQTYVTNSIPNTLQVINKFPGDVELDQMVIYDGAQAVNWQGFQPGRHYMKVTGSLSNNPHYSKPLMVEMYKNTGQTAPVLDIDIADKLFSFGGVSALVDVNVDGVTSTGGSFHDARVSEKSFFPDGLFELGKIYYFTVA